MEKTQKLSKKETILNIDEQNKNCVDCNSEDVKYVSINNGITLCEKCAEEHKKLGSNLSYIRNLDDEFDEYLLNYLVLGSNTKFKKNLELLKININLPIEQKYKTKGVDFYRNNLKNKVVGQKLSDINFEDGNEILAEIPNNFPEFENYQLQNEKKTNFFVGFGKKFLNFSKEIGTKVKNSKVTENIKKGGIAAFSGMKKAGNFVAKKTEPATKQIKKAGNFVGMEVKKGYKGLVSHITKKGKDNNEDNGKVDENKKNEEDNKNNNEEHKEEYNIPVDVGGNENNNNNNNNNENNNNNNENVDDQNKEENKEENKESNEN